MNAWIFAIFVLAAGVVGHLAAVDRVPGRDCGGFWAQVLDRVALWIGIPLLILSCLRSLELFKQWIPSGSTVWLAAVGVMWAFILLLGIVRAAAPEEGRWIAGTLDFSPYRFWILWFALPFLPALWFVRPPWSEDVDAAHWAIIVVFLITLLGIALSAAPARVWTGGQNKGAGEQPLALSPWPEEMRSRGVGLHAIADWQPSMAPEPPTGVDAEWHRRLISAGASGVSPELSTAASQLMGWHSGQSERVAIVLGPDHCGQEEITALAATELARRYGQATLVITSGAADRLAPRLSRWLERLGGESPARLLDLANQPGSPLRGDLLVADAETLSDSVLDELRGEVQRDGDPARKGRGLGNIGLVVWWNAHEFSGVLAAHVWAVSRRLERLLRSRRGWTSRALVFARRPREREAPFVAFLEHLLPYPLKDNQFQIASRFARHTWLYRLEDSAPTAAGRAVEASLLTDWPTLAPSEASLPALMPRPEAESTAAAGARVLEIKPAELLSLEEMICQGGRATPAGIEHHVAVAASENPYAEFLLSRYPGTRESTGASVHLVSAEGHPELVRRHLLLALREVPDTLTGLRENFHWEEDTLRAALQRLSQEGRLSRRPVRFLADGRLQRDSQYANQNPGQSAIRSFHTIGRSRSVELRDRKVKDRLLLEVDPERLPIEAYPMRVFESQGRRYRVQAWTGTPDRIDCIPEESSIRTWRFATSRVGSFTPYGESLSFRGMQRYTARVEYREDVNRVLERDGNGSFRNIGFEVVRTSFETEALILEFSAGFDALDLVSAALALRHVLPVHTAVDEDALQVVPFDRGLALVDLYPGGIGLVNAIHKTVWMAPMLFDRVAEWLSDPSSTAALSASPFVRTMGMGGLDLTRALRVFHSAAMQAQ